MKYLLILLLLIAFISTRFKVVPQHKYLVFTPTIDYFILSQSEQKDTILKSDLADNSRYRFNCTNPTTTTITLIKEDCEYQPSLIIWGKTEDAYTERIYLDSGQPISIAACFQQKDESSWRKTGQKWVLRLFEKTREGVLECPRVSASLGNPQQKKDSLLYYTAPDSSVYYNWESFKVDFYLKKDLVIEEITLTNTTQNGRLLCAAGDSSTIKEIYEEDAKFISKVEQLIKPLPSDKIGMKKYQINAEILKEHLYEKMNLETDYYQLNLTFTTGINEMDFALFNFRLISNTEQQFFKEFMDNGKH